MNSVLKLPLLNEAECEKLAGQINALSTSWIARDALGLQTLGAAAYLDAPTRTTLDVFGVPAPPQDAYQRQMALLNPVLSANFASLYEVLRTVLEEQLNTDVQFAPGKALPGFHIFNHHPQYAQPGTHVAHYDRQYEGLDWNEPVTPENAQTLSFTLPVRLPDAGGGLQVWDIYLQDILGLSREDAKEKTRNARAWRETYSCGELVCHPGHQLHRIAPWKSMRGEQRITLQGHALHLKGSWLLYW